MQATWRDLYVLALLVGLDKHWQNADFNPVELSVERAAYWHCVLTHAHIPQLVLQRKLERALVVGDGEVAWKEVVKSFLDKRALMLIALDHAIRHNKPVVWPTE